MAKKRLSKSERLALRLQCDRYLAENPKATKKQWCELNGLNFASAKRFLTCKIEDLQHDEKPSHETPDPPPAKPETAPVTVRTAMPQIRTTESELVRTPDEILRAVFDDDGFSTIREKKAVALRLRGFTQKEAALKAGYQSWRHFQDVCATDRFRSYEREYGLSEATFLTDTLSESLQLVRRLKNVDVTRFCQIEIHSCPYCHSKSGNKRYSSRSMFDRDVAEHMAKHGHKSEDKRPPAPKADSFDYDPRNERPQPDCINCVGVGIRREYFADYRDLDDDERRRISGLKRTKAGLQIETISLTDLLRIEGALLGYGGVAAISKAKAELFNLQTQNERALRELERLNADHQHIDALRVIELEQRRAVADAAMKKTGDAKYIFKGFYEPDRLNLSIHDDDDEEEDKPL